MRIRACRVLYGDQAPDPTYKNLYNYLCAFTELMPPMYAAYNFFDKLRNLDKYDVPFPTGSEIYTISESEKGFSVDIPTDDGFPARPTYLIINTAISTDPAEYRFAFIISYQRIGEQKIRCTCVFDQWTEHYFDLMQATMSFSRTHQKRYVDRTATPKVKIYNGLSDPVAEAMVQGRKTVEIIPGMYGTTMSAGADPYYYIPIWVYWRVSMKEWYYKDGGTYIKYGSDLAGVDPGRSAVPVLANCIGSVMVRVNDNYKSARGFFPLTKVVLQNGTEYNVTGDMAKKIAFSHPYIEQAILSTIPPFPCHLSANNVLQIDDSAFNVNYYIVTATDFDHRRIGADMFCPTGTFLGWNDEYASFDTYLTEIHDITTNTESLFDDDYEPKIEEFPFEEKTLSMFGAEIDVSPSPAKPNVTIWIPVGSHYDTVLTTGGANERKEIHRLKGITWEFGLDTANDSLSQWLISNFNTYQNTRMWKSINNGVSGAQSLFGSRTIGQAVNSLTNTALSFAEEMDTDAARRKDLQNSPNSVNVSSQNGVDNFPFVDLPVIKKRIIPNDIKTRIMQFWHVYGYPDNRIGTIVDDALTRKTFNFVQGTFVQPLFGTYANEIGDIYAAFQNGVWIWQGTVLSDPVDEIVTSRGAPKIELLQNVEVVEE